MKIVFILVLLCIITYCQAWGRRGGRWSVWMYQSIRNRWTSLCVAHGCCWDGLRNRCNCESGSRSFWRGKRAGKIQVDLSLPNCYCKGYERGGHGRGPRSCRVICTKESSISSNRGNKKSKGSCSQKNQNNDCMYNGNPHRCSDYNNNKQRQFYNELIAAIAPKQCGALNLPNSPCPKGPFNTKRTCSEIDYI